MKDNWKEEEKAAWRSSGFKDSASQAEAPTPTQPGEIRDLPDDFWQWSIELQRGWLWKRCVALQQLADLAGGAALNLIRKQGGSNG